MITLVIGPMFASKSTALLAWERRSKFAKRTVVAFKHCIDARYSSKNTIVTHDGNLLDNAVVTDKLLPHVEFALQYDVILIDEGQFFDDLSEFVQLINSEKKHIVIAALSGDYKRVPFGPVVPLIAMADKIQHQCATCVKCGGDAPFTARISTETLQTVVGGSDKYEPRCSACFSK
jgi:thymidine kinase